MQIIKRCPNCSSPKIIGTISIEDDRYFQKIKCLDCCYRNIKEIGSAVKPEELKPISLRR